MKRSLSNLFFALAVGVIFVNTQSLSYGQDNDGWYGYMMRSGGWGPQGYYQDNPYNSPNTSYNGYGNGPYGYGSTYPYQNANYSGYSYGNGNGTNRSVYDYYSGSDPSFGNNGYDRSSYRYYQKGSAYSRF